MLGMAAAAAFSGASFPVLAGPCTSASLTSYISGANKGCTVLDKTITGMSITAGSPGGSVQVEPVTAVTNNPGLEFKLDNFGSVAGGASVTFAFTVAAPSSDPMTDASLAISGAGMFQVSEGLSNSSISKSLLASNSNPTPTHTTFTAAMSLNVTDALSTASGPSLLGTVINQFSETPVPVPVPKPSTLSSLVLLGVGLSALGLVQRRKRS